MGKPKKKYNPAIDNPIIQATFDAGLGITNAASALGIWPGTLTAWRRDHPELDAFIKTIQVTKIAELIHRYKDSLESMEEKPDWRIPKILQLVHNYYIDHLYIVMPELMNQGDVHSRHDLVLKYTSEGLISIDIAERLSKLLKDNAEIYNMSEIEKKMQSIEAALNAVITKGEL